MTTRERNTSRCRSCGRAVDRCRIVGLDDEVLVVDVGFVSEGEAAGLSLFVHWMGARFVVEPVPWTAMRPRRRDQRRGPYLAAHTEVCKRGGRP
jgi:hypothetical protein